VFFDLYGTLLILGNMRQAWSEWMEVLYASLCPQGSSLSREMFEDSCHQFFGKQQPAPAEDGLTVFERRIRRLAASLGLAVELGEVQRAAARASEAWQLHVRIDPAALEVLGALRQHKSLALISNFDHPPHVHRIIREAGLDVYFDAIVISGDVGCKKPDPEIFRIALEKTGLTADQTVYVGDTQEDVEGAIAAGIRPVLIVRPEEPGAHRMLDYTRERERTADRSWAAKLPSASIISSLHELTAQNL
jgi:putative hydrolase of the HAD superfamily